MRIKQRIELIDRIGRELQARYSYKEIDVFLSHFSLKLPIEASYNSKWLYAKDALNLASDNVLNDIAKELEIDLPALTAFNAKPPSSWADEKTFRLFISHVSQDKDKATRLKQALEKYHISGFVAHEDISPTLEWQEEIYRALLTMDAMIAVYTKGFSQSVWTQQEIGFALGRGIRVISLQLGEDPSGFFGKIQAIRRRQRNAEEVSEEIVTILRNDSATKSRMAQIQAFHQTSIDDDIPF